MPPAFFEQGEIIFNNVDLLKISDDEIRSIRGDRISMIFQEPMTALNPVYTVGNQLAEVYRVHRGMNKKEAIAEAILMLEKYVMVTIW